MRVPAHRVGVREPLHESGQFVIPLGPKDEMPVGGHQAEGQQSRGVCIEGFFQDPEDGVVIGVLAEQGEARHAAVEGVVDIATRGGTRMTRHWGKDTPVRVRRSTKKRALSPFSK